MTSDALIKKRPVYQGPLLSFWVFYVIVQGASIHLLSKMPKPAADKYLPLPPATAFALWDLPFFWLPVSGCMLICLLWGFFLKKEALFIWSSVAMSAVLYLTFMLYVMAFVNPLLYYWLFREDRF